MESDEYFKWAKCKLLFEIRKILHFVFAPFFFTNYLLPGIL